MKKKPDRITRVNELIKRDIAEQLERCEFASGCLVSVTDVKTSPDLRHTKIYISILGGDDETRQGTIKLLNNRRKDIQKNMSQDVVLKYTPVIEFIFDKHYEDADRVLSIIKELDENE